MLLCSLGSQSESESLESTDGAQDGEEDEMSKVVGGLEYAIEREDKLDKSKDAKGKEKLSIKVNGTIVNRQETVSNQVKSLRSQIMFYLVLFLMFYTVAKS
mgnify:CR=1 FL=1